MYYNWLDKHLHTLKRMKMNKTSVITCSLQFDHYTILSFLLHLASFDITNHNTTAHKGK